MKKIAKAGTPEINQVWEASDFESMARSSILRRRLFDAVMEFARKYPKGVILSGKDGNKEISVFLTEAADIESYSPELKKLIKDYNSKTTGKLVEKLKESGIQVTADNKISKKDLEEAKQIAKAGFVSIKAKAGDRVKCVNDKTYHRHYGSGSDWKVPEGVKEGETYVVDSIAEDYFGSNKLVLIVNGKKIVANPLYMDGMNYGQRFELVDSDDDLARVI